MLAKDAVTNEDFLYAVELRRRLHRHPELGFELPETVKLVSSELNRLGIPWTDCFGKASLVAELNPSSKGKTLAIRADMDALPVREKTGLPFASEIDGKMHACGHDAHTGVLLAVARILKRYENELPCRVKLLFQPSEECEKSGARMMMEAGAVDDADYVVCTHMENALPHGMIGVHAGAYMAACDPITIRFFGKTAHAALPQEGVDAIAMAADAYGALKELVRAEAGEEIPYIFSVGCFEGGHAHNVIADECMLKISFRYYDMAFAARVREKARTVCARIADVRGGTVTVDWEMSAPSVHNDEKLTALFERSAEKALPGRVVEMPRRMSTEDFAWFLQKKPGMIFRSGTRNEETGCTALAHCNDFRIDEDGMRAAILAFVQFVFDGEQLASL